MNDITTRADLEFAMAAFYKKLLSDPVIGFVFTDIVKIDLEAHLPHLVDFWEQNILGSGSYRKNVLQIHLDLNRKTRLEPRYFDIWLGYFNETIDENFAGENAEIMKTRARSIATVMQIKIQSRD